MSHFLFELLDERLGVQHDVLGDWRNDFHPEGFWVTRVAQPWPGDQQHYLVRMPRTCVAAQRDPPYVFDVLFRMMGEKDDRVIIEQMNKCFKTGAYLVEPAPTAPAPARRPGAAPIGGQP